MPRINFEGRGCVSPAVIAANRIHARRHFFRPHPTASRSHRLALVGGGPSVAENVAELQTWDGEVWAINGAAQWCIDHDIDAALCTIHPGAYPLEYTADIARAVISEECDPALFAALANAEVSVFALPEAHGTSTATVIPEVALKAGFHEVTFFGCECAYGEQTHIYQHALSEDDIRVKVGEQEFHTKIEFFLQAQWLSELIRRLPALLKERSGGLLRAMIEHPDDWDVTAMSRARMAKMKTELFS